MTPTQRRALERMSKFVTAEGNGCTSWSGGKDWDGYPMFWFEGKTLRAARFLWEVTYGLVPNGLVIRHKCDNPECLNMAHLELGTHSDNTNDARIRGRLVGPRKVTEAMAREIQRLRKQNYKIEEIARRFGISIRSVHNYLK